MKLTIDGKPVLTYQTQPKPERNDIAPEYWRKGYLHPVYSPAGVVVTDDYPKDRLYQHGIWSGWQKVEFEGSHPDLWDAGLKKGRAAMESVSPAVGRAVSWRVRLASVLLQPRRRPTRAPPSCAKAGR